MSEFRLTQISDTHLARRLPALTGNFHRVSEYIDAHRPDLVVNTGDLAFDAPTSPDDLEFARALHASCRCPAAICPQSRHRRQPDCGRPTPSHPASERGRQAFRAAFGEDAGVSRPPAGDLSASIR